MKTIRNIDANLINTIVAEMANRSGFSAYDAEISTGVLVWADWSGAYVQVNDEKPAHCTSREAAHAMVRTLGRKAVLRRFTLNHVRPMTGAERARAGRPYSFA